MIDCTNQPSSVPTLMATPPLNPAPASSLQVPLVLSDLLLYRLSRLQATAGGIALRYCEGQFGITRREWRILALLAAVGPQGSSDLAEHASLDRSRTSKAVTSLVGKKLLLRTTKKGDARQVNICLSPEGVALHAELFPLISQLNQSVLAALQPAEVSLLSDMLERLQGSADRLANQTALPQANRRGGGTARVQRSPSA
jgi:DNA-binding MarR family transcriptional regulator